MLKEKEFNKVIGIIEYLQDKGNIVLTVATKDKSGTNQVEIKLNSEV